MAKTPKLCLYEFRIAECNRVQASESCETYAFFDLCCKTPIACIQTFCLWTGCNWSTYVFVIPSWQHLFHQVHNEVGKSHTSSPCFYKHTTIYYVFKYHCHSHLNPNCSVSLPVPLSTQSIGHRAETWNIKTLVSCLSLSFCYPAGSLAENTCLFISRHCPSLRL